MENKNTIIGIIALIIGATGLGLGVFSNINPLLIEGPPGNDGVDGIDGEDAPGYYCNSGVELQQYLDSIGSGFGNIIINKSFVLTQTIQINGGGSYIIQGQGAVTTIEIGGDWSAFDITNTASCVIKHLKIDSSNNGYSTSIINIDEISNNPVYIEKLQIIGDIDLYGYGIQIASRNVKVSDCHFTAINTGIIILGSFNTIVNNLIRNSQYGIQIFGSNNTINDNTLYMIQYTGILLSNSFSSCNNNKISRNFISNFEFHGISLEGSNFTVISENQISSYEIFGIKLVNCHTNVLSGNQIFDGKNDGITIQNGDYNVITGNLITNISRNDIVSFVGLELWDDSDFNLITGNGIYNCINNGTGFGYGIQILSSTSEENTVIGNTALNNDVNWVDGGTNTFGDGTNNNFS
ncbi:MAG: NosD domain-containing protein [Promethearchaeota archaeon]